MVYKYIATFYTLLLCSILYAQDGPTPKSLTPKDLETQFLQRNYEILIAKYGVDRADAEIMQQRLFPNPNFAISEVNLWVNRKHEQLAPLFGKYGTGQQFSAELDQLIETAGKRKKRIRVAQLEKNNAFLDLEETFLNLRFDLRTTFVSLQKVTIEVQEVTAMVDQLTRLSTQYERHANLQSINKADFFRIRSAAIAWKEELISLQTEQLTLLNHLRRYTQKSQLHLEDLDLSPPTANMLTKRIPANLKELAYEIHIALKRVQNNQFMADSELMLEKANRIPDINAHIMYDRGGNIMQDFVAVGISMDLPLFNKNQGHIRSAKIRIQQEQEKRTGLELELEQTLTRLISQLDLYESTLEEQDIHHTGNFRQILQNYEKNLHAQQVTLLEFIDFSESYINARKAYLNLQEKYHQTFEELQYTIGKDL